MGACRGLAVRKAKYRRSESWPEPSPVAGARWLPLPHGRFALVDKEDFDALNEWNWSYNGYVHRIDTSSGAVKLHREILGCPSNLTIDHINHNTLDNRRANLRICTKGENNRNVAKAAFKGIYLEKSTGKWKAQIGHDHKRLNLGRYETPESAAAAYDKAAVRLFGEFAHLNFPSTS